MAAVRTITCPACGKTHMLGKPCPCGGKKRRANNAGGSRMVGVVFTFLLTAGAIVGGSLTLAETKGTGYGVALALGAWLLLHLCRLGYDWEDGIDVRQRMFPGPWDWPVKFESVINFWTSPRAFFRAAYLGAMLAMIVVGIMLAGDLRGR
jgi:hypothetical protein